MPNSALKPLRHVEKRPRLHRGDIMSPETRSRVMSRIRGKDTGPERVLAAALGEAGLFFEGQCRDLPGRPDFVFRTERIAIFVESQFWHGWAFETWRNKLSPAWELKIEANIQRDRRNHRRLRQMGWRVVRIWDHQIEKDVHACMRRVAVALAGAVR